MSSDFFSYQGTWHAVEVVSDHPRAMQTRRKPRQHRTLPTHITSLLLGRCLTIYLSYQYLVNPHELCFFPGIRVKYFHPAYAFPTPLQCLLLQGSIVLICLCTCAYAYSLVSWFVTFSLRGLCGDGQSGLSLICVATYSLHLVTYHLSKTYI